LLELVKKKYVTGWDDPRMPTISGMRRRGYTPEAIQNFTERIGVAKRDSTVDLALLEFHVREDLNRRAPRFMGVLEPLKVIIDNYPDDQTEELDAINNPEDEFSGIRKIPFTKDLLIEQSDFMEAPPKNYFRLTPGREVRLRYAYFITCTKVVKNKTGKVTEIHCTYDPATRGGDSPDGRKVKGTIHWVSVKHAIPAEIRLYDRLFTIPNPTGDKDGRNYKEFLNPDSLRVLKNCKIEPNLKGAEPGFRFQFERLGYFCIDPDSTPENLVINRTVTLRDTWAKIAGK
jgi:glutaminyl-tRNA synthetase